MLLVNNRSISENMIFESSYYIYRMITKLEVDNSSCVTSMAKTFTQGLVGIIE